MSEFEPAFLSAPVPPGRQQVEPRLAVLEDVPEAITVHDGSGALVFVNDRAAELCGFSTAEAMLQANVAQWIQRFELFDDVGQPLPLSELPGRRVLAGLEAPERLVRFRGGEGRERWSWVSARKLRGSDPPLVINAFREATEAVLAERKVAEELLLSRALQKCALALSSELDHDRLVQRITDEATAICGASFGAFFHNVERDDGKSYLLYTLSGAPREAFEKFGQPRATEVFAPTFRGDRPVRSGDITKDPRFGKMAPHHGMPKGHLPVVSYLAVSVISATGEVLGGLFFGHPEPNQFNEAHERAVAGIATHAAIALDKAQLFRRVRANEQRLASERAGLEAMTAALARSERRFRSLVEASSQMVWSATPDGQIIEDSPSWRAFTGQTLAQWQDSGWLDAVHPEDREFVLAAWRAAVASRTLYEVEYRVRRADGTYAHTLVRGTPVLDREGTIEGWIGLNLDISKRVQAEQALRENDRKLRLALNAGRMGAWEYDLVADVVHWSPQVEQMHGISSGSFDGTFAAFQRDIHPDDRAWVLAAVAQNIEQGREHKLLYRIVRADGATRWLEAFGTFTRDDAGTPTKLVGVCSDVSDRIEAQEATSALRLRKMLEGISDAFSVYDTSWTVIFANDAGTAPLGLTPAEVIGKSVWELVPATIGTKFHSELLRVRNTQQATTFEEYYAPLDRWFEVHAYPVADVGIAAYSRDVTARHREQAFQQRLARYAALRVEVGAALSAQGDLGAMLQCCCEAIGAGLQTALTRLWLVDSTDESLELQGSAGATPHEDDDHRQLRTGSSGLGSVARQRKPLLTNDIAKVERLGLEAWARERGFVALAAYPLVVGERAVGLLVTFGSQPLFDDTLVALGSVGDAIAQGIERRRAELALEEHARDLARSNAELQQFAYVASHDLQEPLRMVASYVQLLERRYKDKLDADAHDFIGYAVEGVTRMRRLIEDLLSYSRVGTQAREPSLVALDDVVALAEKNLERAIVESCAAITCDELPEVLGDQGQLVQLFQNLLGNAIKFRGERAPAIHIAARQDGELWVLSVQDNGIGIDAQYFERIFAIFQRLNPREQYPGTGIGLSIAKKIVERHGGRIWVESTQGQGTTISFSLSSAQRTRRSSP
ncbi:MAG: multi-sensor signal transduction histidine kinase [Myxococcaceae bacterium]|nr:multi-sensor signal transduction histidine kinase [Myxococcaceae bacterium]